MKSLVAILGPTASGKSALGEQIAGLVGGEIVSCDSVQVYKGFNIGTSKATPEEQDKTPHHLIDVVSATDEFHAGRYQTLADSAITAILERGRLPLVVGGTGLYLRALLHGLSPVPPIAQAIQDELKKELEDKGLPALFEELLRVDPDWAMQYPETDTQRILRGLAVFRQTQKPLSVFNEEHQFSETRYRFRLLAIHHERPQLYERINARVLAMMEMGFMEEVKALLDQGVPRDSRPMLAPGYLQLARVLDGTMDMDQAVEDIQQAHRRYAKRQMTWLRKTPGIEWVSPTDDMLPDTLTQWWNA